MQIQCTGKVENWSMKQVEGKQKRWALSVGKKWGGVSPKLISCSKYFPLLKLKRFNLFSMSSHIRLDLGFGRTSECQEKKSNWGKGCWPWWKLQPSETKSKWIWSKELHSISYLSSEVYQRMSYTKTTICCYNLCGLQQSIWQHLLLQNVDYPLRMWHSKRTSSCHCKNLWEVQNWCIVVWNGILLNASRGATRRYACTLPFCNWIGLCNASGYRQLWQRAWTRHRPIKIVESTSSKHHWPGLHRWYGTPV